MVYIEITLNSLLPQNNCYPCTSLLEPVWPLLGISRHPFYNKIRMSFCVKADMIDGVFVFHAVIQMYNLQLVQSSNGKINKSIDKLFFSYTNFWMLSSILLDTILICSLMKQRLNHANILMMCTFKLFIFKS